MTKVCVRYNKNDYFERWLKMARQQFVSSAIKGQSITQLRILAKQNPSQFRKMARQEFKLVNQQIKRTGANKSPFTIRGKSNEQVIDELKRSRKYTSSVQYHKTPKRKKPTTKPKIKAPKTPRIEIPTIETPTIETPTIETPTIETPTYDNYIDESNDFEYWDWQTPRVDEIMNQLKNEYPQFYDDFYKAIDKYKEFVDDVEELIETTIDDYDGDMEQFAKDFRQIVGARVGAILQKSNGQMTDYWSSFRK